MTILFLEDRGSVALPIKALLEERGHTVLHAFNCNDAETYLPECDCYIVDLNLSTDGLSSEEVQQTKGGKLTGWVWLKRHYPSKQNLDLLLIFP